MIVTGLLIMIAAPAQTPPAVSPVRCRIAADRMAQWTLLGQGMIENLERRGVPAHRKEAYDAMVATIAVDEPLTIRMLERFEQTQPTKADEAAFGSPNPQQMRALLQACDVPAASGGKG
jgi:hypothetical protein